MSVTLAVPREDPHQNAGFFNDFGFPYGYAKGSAGFGTAVPNHSPFPTGRVGFSVDDFGMTSFFLKHVSQNAIIFQDMFGYSPPPGTYGRPPYDAWVSPPTMQATPRSSRNGPPAHEQPWYRIMR